MYITVERERERETKTEKNTHLMNLKPSSAKDYDGLSYVKIIMTLDHCLTSLPLFLKS